METTVDFELTEFAHSAQFSVRWVRVQQVAECDVGHVAFKRLGAHQGFQWHTWMLCLRAGLRRADGETWRLSGSHWSMEGT